MMDDERLLYSTGIWHRKQRKRVPFYASCYYTHETVLPYGCQYSKSLEPAWKDQSQRATERSVLMDFWDATGRYTWRTTDNWGAGDPCWDSWYGITCDEHGYVISIELVDNRLEGTLPPSLMGLNSLLKIDISTSAVEYGNHVNKNANRVTGVVPSLTDMTQLEEIIIAGNDFVALPDDLYLIGGSLRLLTASYNRISTLPKYLNRFTEIHTMEIDHNELYGRIPPDFGFMVRAQFVDLSNNYLTGPMPNTVSGLTRIRTFDVSYNAGVTGAIPEDIIVNWVEVEYLSILSTGITGYIAALCLDVAFCWKYMFDTHKDMTWATAAEVPDIVNQTIELAKTNPDGPVWDPDGTLAIQQAQEAAAADEFTR
jgi:hypothetical protein